MSVPSIDQQRARYAQAREALWGKPRRVNVLLADTREAESEAIVVPPAPKPLAIKLVWVRQYNEHVIAFRRWQLAEEQGKEYTPLIDRPDGHTIIMDVLQNFPGVTVDEIKGPRRERRIIVPRQIAIYQVYKQRPDMSFPQIGRLFGGRDHTTCLHAVRKMEKIYGEARG